LMPLPFGCGVTLPGIARRLLASVGFRLRGYRPPAACHRGGFRCRWPGPRRYGWLSPRGCSVSCTRPVNRDGILNFPPAGRHFCIPAESALPVATFAVSWQGRSALRSFRTVRTVGPTVARAFTLIFGGSPRPSGRAEPFLGGGPHPIATLSGSDRAGDSPLFSSLASFPFRVSGLRVLSDLPAGPSSGDFQTFIDSRSGLSRQPNASARVASR